MANYAPLNLGTNAAGGYLAHEQYGPVFIDGIRRESAIAQLAQTDVLTSNKKSYNRYLGRPTVQFVDEGQEKPVTGAEFGRVTVNVRKLAGTVVFTEEMIEDVDDDPRLLIAADVQGAIANKIDANALGYEAGSSITSAFDSELGESSATHELGSGGDALAKAVSDAMESVEANGYRPNGIILASDARAHIRNSRQTVETAQPVYSAGYEREPDSLYGLPIYYSSNLDGFPAGAGQKVAIVGDFTQCVLAIRKAITTRVTDSATINIGGTQHNLWQRNEIAVLWETRVGFVAHDLNQAFSVVTNAS